MNSVKSRIAFIAVPVLFTVLHSASSSATQFDESKRVVLPSQASTTILKWYVSDNNWSTEEWPVSSEELDHLELDLATAMARVPFFSGKLPILYRQYMPARWKGLHLIVVNGFDETMLEMEKSLDKNIDLTKWKRDLVVSFGGGCLQWRSVYIVEQSRFMVLKSHGHHTAILCNAPE